MANITQVDGAAPLTGTADADIIIAQHENAIGVPNPQILTGGDGNDVIFGDHDSLFIDNATGNNTTGTAIDINNIQHWGQRENPDVENSTSVPYTTILGTGAGELNFYAVSVGAGETITIDVDYGDGSLGGPGFDSVVTLRDSGGGAVASNDDDNSDGIDETSLGTVSSLDSFLTFTNAGAAATFFIEVDQFSGGGVPVGATYMLNVSVTNHVMSNFSIQGADDIDGGSGDDVIYGAEGDDTLDGGADDDLIEGGSGADAMDGGAGIDTLSYVSSTAGVNVELRLSSAGGGGDSTGDTYVNFENLTGSSFDDFLAGNNDANVIDGGAGIDRVSYFFDDAAVTANLSTGIVTGGSLSNGDTLLNIERLSGSNGFGDNLTGDANANTLIGDGGDDVLEGLGGADVLNGGAGSDTASYENSGAGVQVNLDTPSAAGGDAAGDTFISIENLIGSNFIDTLTGDANDNIIDSLDGNDTVSGLGGDDTLFANFGSDDFDGGTGTDTYQIEGSSVDSTTIDFDINLNTGTDTFGNTYVGIENINAGSGEDTIVADGANNVINGGDGDDILSDGGGADTIDAGAGDDIIRLTAGNSDFLLASDSYDGGTGTDTFEMSVNRTGATIFDMAAGTYLNQGLTNTVTNFENFDSGGQTVPASFEILGTSGNNSITTSGADDIIEGRGGADTMDGGAGNDTASYAGAAAGVTADLAVPAVNTGDAAGDTYANIENLTGSDFADTLAGDGNDNVLTGGDGADILDGRGGGDSLLGGNGDDDLRMGTEDAFADVYDGGANFDTLRGDGGRGPVWDLRDDTVSSVERIVYSFLTTGGLDIQMNAAQYAGINAVSANAHAGQTVRLSIDMDTETSLDLSGDFFTGFTEAGDGVTINGDGDAENIIGSSVNDTINGNGGDDTIEGGAGADILDGGLGNDTASYAGSSAGVGVLLSFNFANGGDATGDTLTNIENLTGSDFADTFDGDSGDNILRGGLGGDTLTGRAGIDQLFGEGGNDFLQILDGNDGIGETYDGGADTDMLQFFGNGASTFNLRDDTVAGIEILQFNGGFGGGSTAEMNASQLVGVTSATTFNRTAAAERLDILMGSETNLDLSSISFTGFTEPGDGVTISGDSDNETITGSSIVDIINGGSGSDTLSGGDGNDIINDGGGGTDNTDGGAGDDIIIVNLASGGETHTGGTGVDTLDLTFDNGGSQTLDLSAPTFTFFGATMSGFENVTDGTGGNTIIGSSDVNVLDGGGGIDTLSYENSSAGVVVNLGSGLVSGGDAAGDTISNFENLTGSAFSDNIGGDSNDNVISGGDGDDTINGFAGADTMLGGAGNDTLRAGDSTTDIVAGDIYDGGTDTDTLEAGASGPAIDMRLATLTSLETLDIFTEAGFFSGDKTVQLNAAQFTGSGFNEITSSRRVGGEVFELELFMDTATVLDLSGLTFSGVFGAVGDGITINGDGDAETITGSSTNDTIITGGGIDYVIASAGADDVNLGADNDIVQFSPGTADAATYDGDAGTFDIIATGGAGTLDLRATTLLNFESLQFLAIPSATQTVQLNASQIGTGLISATATIDGNELVDGVDKLQVFMGTETTLDLSGLNFIDWQTGPGNQGDDIRIFGDSDSENITGSSIVDIVFGGGGVDTINGGAGNDLLQGQGGTDIIDGGADNDQIAGGAGGDMMDGGADVDALDYFFSTAGVTVNLDTGFADGGYATGDTFSNFENLTGSNAHGDDLTGDAGDNRLVGNGGDDTLNALAGQDTVLAGDGDDTIIDNEPAGPADDDVYDGGAGSDTLISTGIQWGPNVVFDLLAGEQRIGGAVRDTYTNIENVTVNGRAELQGDNNANILTAGNFGGAGGPGSFANIINGAGGDDIINAGADDDVINGGTGDDMIDGGTNGSGGDTASYTDAAGGVSVYLQYTGIDVGGGEGSDTLIDIENLTGGVFDDRLVGNSGNNVLTGGDGADILKGKNGDDIFEGGDGDDRLTGGSGIDIMNGGDGSDILYALAGDDILNGGDGDDFVYGGRDADTVHGDAGDDNVRGNLGNDMIFGDAGQDDLRGGGSNDMLDGGTDSDFLFGENGKDTLIGGAGSDSLSGGSGGGVGDGFEDTFVYSDTASGGGGFDRIKDMENGTDLIDLSSFSFANFAVVQSLATSANGGLDTRINFGGGDVLYVENFALGDFDASDVVLI